MTLPSELISTHSLFEGLSPYIQDQITRNAIRKTYRSEEIIINHGDIWPYLFLVEKGEINAIKESSEGRVLIATTLKPGDIFWGLSFFIDGAEMPVMLQACSDSKIYLWSQDYLMPIITENGSMAWKLCQLMISRMQLASAIVDDLAFQPVMSRLAKLLLEIFGDTENEFMARELTLENMAAHIGTTQEMVCRHLYRFAERGAIEIRRTEIKINNRSYIEKQAGR